MIVDGTELFWGLDSFVHLERYLTGDQALSEDALRAWDSIEATAEAALSVAEHVVDAGITGILNFAPVTLNLPKTVSVVGVDLAMELEQLAFAVVKNLNK